MFHVLADWEHGATRNERRAVTSAWAEVGEGKCPRVLWILIRGGSCSWAHHSHQCREPGNYITVIHNVEQNGKAPLKQKTPIRRRAIAPIICVSLEREPLENRNSIPAAKPGSASHVFPLSAMWDANQQWINPRASPRKPGLRHADRHLVHSPFFSSSSRLITRRWTQATTILTDRFSEPAMTQQVFGETECHDSVNFVCAECLLA